MTEQEFRDKLLTGKELLKLLRAFPAQELLKFQEENHKNDVELHWICLSLVVAQNEAAGL
jgi:hypothetical protein